MEHIPAWSTLALLAGVLFGVSVLASAAGAGGGMLLTGVLSTFVPASALIPVQNAILLCSSLSRAALYRATINWQLAWPFMLGLGAGSLLGAHIYVQLPENWLNVLIATVMLAMTWGPSGGGWLTRFVFVRVAAGAVHGFLSSLTGVGGLLQSTFNRLGLNKNTRIGTFAVVITANNLWRGLAFALLGVSLTPYWAVIALAIPVAIAGSWVGKRIGHCISEVAFDLLLKTLVTGLAVNLLWKTLWPALELGV